MTTEDPATEAAALLRWRPPTEAENGGAVIFQSQVLESIDLDAELFPEHLVGKSFPSDIDHEGSPSLITNDLALLGAFLVSRDVASVHIADVRTAVVTFRGSIESADMATILGNILQRVYESVFMAHISLTNNILQHHLFSPGWEGRLEPEGMGANWGWLRRWRAKRLEKEFAKDQSSVN